MAAPNPFRYYSRSILLALSIGYVVGLLLLVVPYALIGSINDTASGHAFLVSSDWLGTLGGIGVLLLIAEAIFVMAYDWRGAMTLRGMARSQILRKGQMVNTAAGYALLY